MQLGWGVREQWQSCEKAHVIYTIQANRVPAGNCARQESQ
jgi:hypothetical protein